MLHAESERGIPKKRDGGPSTIHSLPDGPIFSTSKPPLIHPSLPSSRLSLPPFFCAHFHSCDTKFCSSGRVEGMEERRLSDPPKALPSSPPRDGEERNEIPRSPPPPTSSTSVPLHYFFPLLHYFPFLPSISIWEARTRLKGPGAASSFSTINDVLREAAGRKTGAHFCSSSSSHQVPLDRASGGGGVEGLFSLK